MIGSQVCNNFATTGSNLHFIRKNNVEGYTLLANFAWMATISGLSLPCLSPMCSYYVTFKICHFFVWLGYGNQLLGLGFFLKFPIFMRLKPGNVYFISFIASYILIGNVGMACFLPSQQKFQLVKLASFAWLELAVGFFSGIVKRVGCIWLHSLE